MSRLRAKQKLLADVLSGQETASFRDALLSETLGLVRHRRRARHAWRAVAAIALVAGLGLLMWRSPLPVARRQASRGYALVLSRPLAAAAVVSTQPLAAGQIVASRRNVEVVQTASSRPTLHEIGDSELLALAGARPAALVRLGPHLAELVFANPEDREALVRN